MTTESNRVALVTGGASGIGRALGAALVAQGARVVLADVDAGRVQATAAELGCVGRALDVRDPEQWRALVEEIRAELGPIDLLVNNAGRVQTGETHLLERADWSGVIDVNLYGVVNGVQAVYPSMVERRAGQIINVASIAGLFPSAGQVSYVASKFGVVGLSHALRVEAARHRVRVSVACPGVIHTPMRDTLTVKGMDPEALRAQLPKGIPVERCARVILAGARRDRPTILVTWLAKALAALMRLSPTLGHWVNRRMFDHLIRRANTPPRVAPTA
jgi:NADP-dependent 3-hydroxy acid dehydrogenase YdfG